MAKKEKLSLEELLGQALVKDEDKPYAVPENWVWTKLNYLCAYIQRGKSPKYSEIETVPVISQKCIQWAGFDITKARFIDYDTVANYALERFIQPMDLLWNSTGTGTVGRINYYPYDASFDRVVADSHVTVIRSIKGKVSPKFLYYWFSSSFVQDKINTLTSGTTNQIELSTAAIKAQMVPLASLAEQQRIVQLIESLFDKLDRAKELAQNALDSFENRKSAILHKALAGELTRKWREENGAEDSYEILSIEFNKRKKMYDKLKKKSMPNFMSYSLVDINRNDDRIPDNWIVCPVGILCDCIVPGRDKPKSFTGDIPWITIPNIENDYINKSAGQLYLSLDEIQEVRAKIIPSQSVIMSCIGRFGISAIVNNECVINQQLHAFLPSNLIVSKYLMYHIRYLKDHMLEISTSTTVAYLNKEACNSLPINLPPLAEQQEIVRILDNLLENERKAKELCSVIDKIDHIKKSILVRAFRGKLGTNNSTDESSLELLKEVLMEKM